MATQPKIGRSIGTSTYPITVGGSASWNMKRDYYRSASTGGDTRVEYRDLEFKGVAGGELLRLRVIANGLLCATGATVNAIHATGRVAAAGTVSGALNAIRATLEVAGSTPTPGGTLAALQLDSNIVTGATMGASDAFVRVTDSGATALQNLFNIASVTIASDTPTSLVSTHADHVSTHLIRCMVNGSAMWLLATNAHT